MKKVRQMAGLSWHRLDGLPDRIREGRGCNWGCRGQGLPGRLPPVSCPGFCSPSLDSEGREGGSGRVQQRDVQPGTAGTPRRGWGGRRSLPQEMCSGASSPELSRVNSESVALQRAVASSALGVWTMPPLPGAPDVLPLGDVLDLASASAPSRLPLR